MAGIAIAGGGGGGGGGISPWDYLLSIGIPERKLRHAVEKCPKILFLPVEARLAPTVECLAALESRPGEAALAIAKFPRILFHSIEQKLCPLLAFLQTLGLSQQQQARLLLHNPRLVSYSIQQKFAPALDFFASDPLRLGLADVGRILVREPCVLGYSVEKRLRPTLQFLTAEVGLADRELRRAVLSHPLILCRDAERALRPNLVYLRGCGFEEEEIAALAAGYPPVLFKSVRNCLGPRIRFLVEKMGRELREVLDYPEFFRHGLRKRLEVRHRIVAGTGNAHCRLKDMLDCNNKKFAQRFGLLSGSH